MNLIIKNYKLIIINLQSSHCKLYIKNIIIIIHY